MPSGQLPVFTLKHKIAGNLVPILILLVVGGAGFWEVFGTDTPIIGWVMLALAPVFAWLAVNATGLWENASLKETMARKVKVLYPRSPATKYFVGFAHPAYFSLWDPHEDVGYLILHREKIEFLGSNVRVEFSRGAFRSLTRRANPHTLLGLGGWLSLEGSYEGQPIRMLIEPREASTLLGNKSWANFMETEIKKWAASQASIPEQIPDTLAETLVRQPISTP